MTPIFQATVLGGQIMFHRPKEVKEYIQTFEGKPVNVTIEKWKEKRTIQQNRWYWVCVVHLPAESFGYLDEEMHEIYKSMFLKEEREIKGKRYELVRSTTSLNTEEFSEYIEKCRMWAANEGIVIPDPLAVVF
jgi:hypothetical protein